MDALTKSIPTVRSSLTARINSPLREFCLLRAASVDGQLNGTIPSTSEGQAQDSSTLVDASELTVADMGSMGNAMGRGEFSGKTEFGDMPDGMHGRFSDFDDIPDDIQRNTPDNRGEHFNRFDGQNDALEAFNPFNGSAGRDCDSAVVPKKAPCQTSLINITNGVDSHSQLRYFV